MQLTHNRFWLLLVVVVLFGCKKGGELFQNPSSSKTGITFTNTLTETNDLNILDYLYFYNGGGVAVGDINGDELPDIFFSGNQVKNKLYLNKGNLKFEDITETAGVAGNSSWNTGAVMGDVNGDGLLDIYVCAVVGINGFDGFNELYINNGVSASGEVRFTESATKYGLDFDSYSSNAAFLDYDLDGDLDIYLLNHAVHTQNSYGKADLRLKRTYESGDKLLRNDNGKFTDVSEAAGIYGGINSYGLGLAVADFNQDGYPDIYVGNDFHEDDYYYLNNGDGTFTESLKTYFGHISRFSMGNDVADINHDGWPDLMSLDMLPEDEFPLKASEGDDNIQTQRMRIKNYGYHYQFTRNMLFINQPNTTFTETALQSGVAATDWSWSALFADFDQDTHQDLFVSNGIPKRPNDLDFIKFVSNDQIKNKIDNTKLVDQKAFDLMPTGAVHNYVFKGKKDYAFEDKSGTWASKDTLISGASALADFDNDGDLDVVTANLNQAASLYINQTNGKHNYLKLKFQYKKPNTLGIGTKVFAYANNQLQYKELYTVRGFQASSEPLIHFGFGSIETIDSLKIVWPNKSYQIVKNVAVNQTLLVQPKNTNPFDYNSLQPNIKPLFKKVEGGLGIAFSHKEDNYLHFNREKLIPYQLSDRGPAVAIGDLNGDHKDDIFFGGSKFIPASIYLQQDSTYVTQQIPEIQKDSIKEIVQASIADFNNDGQNDLILGAGGADFFGKSPALLNTYFTKTDTTFSQMSLPESFENNAVIRPFDFDNDGDLDVFIGNHAKTAAFGMPATSMLLANNKGVFEIAQSFEGMLTDAVWDDFDGDGIKDLIVVGEWMAPQFYKNDGSSLSEVTIADTGLKGLFQAIIPFDIDKDGDTDYLLGNWGTNSKFKACTDYPMQLLVQDFDGNGQSESIVVIEKNKKYYPLQGLDDLAGQLVSLRKKFTSYKEFAGETITEIFDEEQLKNANTLEVTELRSGYLENTNGEFRFIPFSAELQVAPILSFLRHDFDSDQQPEVLAAGNYFGVKPYHGRFDSFSGALIQNNTTITLGNRIGLDFTQKSIRHLNIIYLKNKPYLLATFNNEKAEIYEFKVQN